MTQDQAFDILAMGHNVFLTGAAGTGKTYLINRFIRHAREHGIVIAVTASTGIAATHIGGMTIHSWSGMGIRDTLSDEDIDVIVSREYLAKRFAKTNILIIDEVSMLSGVFLANLDRLLRSVRFSQEPFGGIQVILVGDFFQLPPVSRGSDIDFAFENPSWRTFRLAICVLTVQYRQSNLLEKGGVMNGVNDGGLVLGEKQHISFRSDLEENARELRKDMTGPEKHIWYNLLKREKLEGLHFLRQKPLLDYIVDFYCPELKLVIEIDGESHVGNELYDENRTKELEIEGITVIRFLNNEVTKNLEGVYEKLVLIVSNLQKHQSSVSPTASQLLSQGAETDPLLQILNEIRSGNVSQNSHELLRSRNIPVTTEDHTELFTRNVSVDSYNTDRLNQIQDDTFLFEMQSKGGEKLVEALKKGCLAPETLILKKGARVMFVKNNFEAGYVNGSIGHIVGRYENLPIVELQDGTRIIADYMDWSIEENGKIKATILQVPLRLAWAITVHKSQGMTLDTAVIDLSDAFVRGQGYVALSRVRSLGGLILRGYNSTALQIDPRVREYDEILRATSEKVIERLGLITESEKQEKIDGAIRRLGGILQKIDLEFIDPKRQKLATHEETFAFLQTGKSLEDIAEIRGIKVSTIFSHIEKLLEEGKEIDLTPHLPEDMSRLSDIHAVFVELGTLSLSPVREFLASLHDEDYTYDELRMARLFLSPEDRTKIQAIMLYESEGIG